MFKKYRMGWKEGDSDYSADFFVHSKKTRGGFMHRACVIGPLPRLDQNNGWAEYRANEDKLFSKRVVKVSYCNRTWERWSGQTCLSKLWEQLSKLKFLDMTKISPSDPFNGDEPPHDDMYEPDELFDGFRRT